MRILLLGVLVISIVSQPEHVYGQVAAPESTQVRTARFVYKQTEHRDLELVVDYPREWRATDSRAAVVFFYGGGWAYTALDHFRRQAEYFASRGMVAIRPDVRVRDPDGTTPAESVEDAKSAIRWIRSHADSLGIDPERIVAGGGSSGGHLAACTAQCSGPENTDEYFSISSRPDALILFNPLLRYSGLRKIEEAYPVVSDEIARQISPNLHMQEEAPPTLLLFGSEDPLLVWAASYVDRARELGNHLELYVAHGQSHAFFNDSPWYEETLMRADRFLVSFGYLPEFPVTVER